MHGNAVCEGLTVDELLRLDCVSIASQTSPDGSSAGEIVAKAEKLRQYIKTEVPSLG